MMKRSARFGVDALRCPVLVNFAAYLRYSRYLSSETRSEHWAECKFTKIGILDAKRKSVFWTRNDAFRAADGMLCFDSAMSGDVGRSGVENSKISSIEKKKMIFVKPVLRVSVSGRGAYCVSSGALPGPASGFYASTASL